MPTCSFCKRSYKESRGLTIFTFDGRAVHYCSSKCRKNFVLGRNSKRLKWTKKGKDFSEEKEEKISEKSKESES